MKYRTITPARIAELEKNCEAVIYHGPGHQSKSRCMLTGIHEVHENGGLQWVGAEGMSGFFDESPMEGSGGV